MPYGPNPFWYINHGTWIIILTGEGGPPSQTKMMQNTVRSPWLILYTNLQSSIFLLTENQRTLLRSQLFLCFSQKLLDFSQQILNFCLDFLSHFKNAQKFKCSQHLARAWHLLGSLLLNPYDFNKMKNIFWLALRHLSNDLTRLNWLNHKSVLPLNWNPSKIFALTV